MKQLIFIISLVVMGSSAFAGGNPAVNVAKVFEFWMGKSADCSDLVKVVDMGTNGKDVDTEQSVDVGAGTLPPAGTYNCLAIVVLDTSVMKPAASDGTNCQASHFYAQKTFRGSSRTILPSDKNTTINPIGTDGSSPQVVAAYFSTDANATGGGVDGGHMPPWASANNAADNYGAPLAGGAVTVGETSMSKTFFVDCSGKVISGQNGVYDLTGNTVMGAGAGCATNSCVVGFR